MGLWSGVWVFLPARRCASAGTSYGPVSVSVCLSVCLSQVGVLSKRMNGLVWFLTWGLLSTSLTLCFKEIRVSTKINSCRSIFWALAQEVAKCWQIFDILRSIDSAEKTFVTVNDITSPPHYTFIWNFFVNSGLRKFRHGISIVERSSLSRSERDKLDRRSTTVV